MKNDYFLQDRGTYSGMKDKSTTCRGKEVVLIEIFRKRTVLKQGEKMLESATII